MVERLTDDVFVSIVFPAFNEGVRIEETLSKWIRFLDEHYFGKYEILVVMDGCTDNTVDIVLKFTDRPVVPLIYPRRLGKGGALIEAFKYSKGDVVFFTDADGSLDVDAFRSFMYAIRFSDLVIGCRYFRGSEFINGLPFYRLLLSRIFNCLVRLLFPSLMGFYDTQCGAKAIRRDVISKIDRDLFISDFAFDVNLIYSVLRHGFIVREIAVGYNHVKCGSKISCGLLKISFRMFLSTIKLRLYYSRFRKLLFRDGILKNLIGFLMRIIS